MSQQNLSTMARLGSRSWVLSGTLSVAFAVAIIVLAAGPQGLVQLVRFGLAHPWIAHTPDLGALAAAPLAVKIHLATVLPAFAIGAVQMLGPKGRTAHRVLGWAFVVLMTITAIAALFIPNQGAADSPCSMRSA